MNALLALWLPILLSAVVVFIISSILHMVLKGWHTSDYKGFANEDDVRAAINAGGISYAAPEGTVSLDPITQHTVKPVRIGQIREDGLIDTIWETEPVVPDPYLCGYAWASVLTRPEGVCDAMMATPEATPAS